MNILYLCDEYPPGRHGGIGTSVQMLARQMVKAGHNVVVAGWYDWGYNEQNTGYDMGVKVYRFRRKLATPWLKNRDSMRVRGLYKIFRAFRIFDWDIRTSLKPYHAFLEGLIAEHHIDLVEMPDFNEYMAYCLQYTPFPKLSVPVVVKLHGSLTYFAREAGQTIAQHILRMEEDLLEQADGVVSVSKYTAARSAEYLDYRKPIEVLYNGISLPGAPAVSKIPLRVVFTGTLVEKKGIYQLAKAWNIVHQHLPKAELYIFGKGDTAKIRTILSGDAAETVFFKGHIAHNELLQELKAASLAVFPSFAETFGLGAAEAMACNVPVIFSRLTSGPELIEHGADGYLADPTDVQDIAGAIIELLTNHKLAARLAEAGVEKIKNNFAIAKVAANHISYYQDILNKIHARDKNTD